ncbi:MAG TPA: LysM peptidoglycan-binding domain-containing protein [Parachlamydiaceae bacterium]|nr:LysM peptidoglycan-binding domain-containing protein [Parachlamydiaceae bacterium]
MVDSIHYIRKLTAFLVVSGSLNIILIVMIFYWAISDRPPTPYIELKPANRQEQQTPLAIDRSDSEVIRYFRRMPLQWLISRLNNTQLVENGYTQRDLALASLVAFHYFDLERAFAGLAKPQEKRRIVYGKFRDGRSAELIVYPGLSDKHFEAVRTFATTERWPLTSRGLFLALQKEEKEEYDSHLLDAFYMTSDFSTVEMLFSRSELPVGREELLKVILEGNWTQLSGFVEQQKKSQDLSQARRQSFLLDYASNKSKAAAQVMLKTDGTFAAKKLDDSQAMMLLQLVDEKSPQAKQFALTLLKSPRSDAVRKLAADRLYEYAGADMPETYQHQAALARFAPKNATAIPEPPVLKKNIQEVPKAVPKAEVVVIAPVQVPAAKQTQTVAPPAAAKPATPKPVPQQAVPTKPLSTKAPAPTVTMGKTPPAPRRDFYYEIQEGDTLWKIGRRFGVDIEVLRAFNQLDKDVLHPGRSLRIPTPEKK